MVDFSGNVAVLRRWAVSRPNDPLPANFAEWRGTNITDFMKLQQQDPELVSLLSGTAPATLVADTLQGQLSPVPMSQEERKAVARKQEMQRLYDLSRSEQGLNFTQQVQVESEYPELWQKIKSESAPTQTEQLSQAHLQRAAQEQMELRQESVARAMRVRY